MQAKTRRQAEAEMDMDVEVADEEFDGAQEPRNGAHGKQAARGNPFIDPYIAARREWNERYGSHIVQARMWRVFALGTLLVAAGAVAGLIWMSTQNRIVPYVVQVDRLGESVAVGRADAAGVVDPRIVKAQLARWVVAVRTVNLDVAIQRRLVEEAYYMVNRRAAGGAALNDFYRGNEPFKRAEVETIEVRILSVVYVTGDTWRVEWLETRRDRTGNLKPERSGRSGQRPDGESGPAEGSEWQAMITIAVKPPDNEAEILINPMGIYINSFSWAPRL